MLFEDTYKTIKGKSEGTFKDRGSKFIALAVPVSSEDDVKKELAEIKTAYHDARHHCFAYLLGQDKSTYRMNDDGEPSGTAGRPILGQINSNDLTNILVVVVRYFGGAKLGVRGLIDAYKSATANALESADKITKTINEIYTVDFEYPLMNSVMSLVKDENLNIRKQNFDLACQIEFDVRKSDANRVYEKFNKINGLKINYLRTI
ncbi:MAG: YigZ family protein [Bacteroidetes bacterium]|nr:YigZ family protein [Bacteroidota bacterium]